MQRVCQYNIAVAGLVYCSGRTFLYVASSLLLLPPLLPLLLLAQDLVSAAGDGMLLGRVAKVLGYIAAQYMLLLLLLLLALLLLLLQDLVSAAGDGLLLGRVAKVLGYIAASSKGGKKGERDSAYIRSILAGGNPAAGGDAQVGPCKPVECRVVSGVLKWGRVRRWGLVGASTGM